MSETRLDTTPPLAGTLLRAALTARGRGGALPDRTLVRDHVEIDRDHLTRYQRLCGFPVGDTIPLTYPHVLGFGLQAALMAERDFPVPMPGLVHLANEFEWIGPWAPHEPVTISVRAQRLEPHRSGRTVDLITQVSGADRELLWVGRSTYLQRGPGMPGAPQGSTPPPLPTGNPSAVWRFAADAGRRYAAVSGDVNPIHLHPWTAKALGQRGAIAHGMFTVARVIAALPTAPQQAQVWFRRPVPLPSTVELVVARSADGPAGGSVAGLRKDDGDTAGYLTVAAR